MERAGRGDDFQRLRGPRAAAGDDRGVRPAGVPSVSRRTREMGIRVALGATCGEIARLVLREGLRTTLAGLIVGVLLAGALGKLASGLLVGVSPIDPLALGAAAAVLSAATLVASWLPARRAARVAPLDALRTE